LQTWSVSLLDRRLRVGRVNKPGGARKSLGTQRILPTLLLTRLGTDPKAGQTTHFQHTNRRRFARLAYFESCATIVLSRGVEMNYDHDKVDEMVLALLYLTISEQHEWGARAWKSHDWDALDRLHTKGYISDPKSKAKSVVLNAEGVKRARELFEQHFGR